MHENVRKPFLKHVVLSLFLFSGRYIQNNIKITTLNVRLCSSENSYFIMVGSYFDKAHVILIKEEMKNNAFQMRE